MLAENPGLEILSRAQRTLKNPVAFSGIGLHTGEEVSIRFCPADEGTGIVFERTDLSSRPIIPATLEYVGDTSRNTTIALGDVRIHTVEHLLSAFRGLGIDNVRIEIDSIEPPAGDGSSAPFVELIKEAGTKEQAGTIPVVKLAKPIYWSEGEVHIVALPDECFRISYTLHYPTSGILKAQYFTCEVTPEIYTKQISTCRTFSRYDEIVYLMDQQLIKGGSLSNAVVIKDDIVLSSGGLRFSDEMVRHKVLDLIGDLSLVGFNFTAHIIAIRSGHAANCAFAKKFYDHITMETVDGRRS